jgi:hypothetical protein
MHQYDMRIVLLACIVFKQKKWMAAKLVDCSCMHDHFALHTHINTHVGSWH